MFWVWFCFFLEKKKMTHIYRVSNISFCLLSVHSKWATLVVASACFHHISFCVLYIRKKRKGAKRNYGLPVFKDFNLGQFWEFLLEAGGAMASLTKQCDQHKRETQGSGGEISCWDCWFYFSPNLWACCYVHVVLDLHLAISSNTMVAAVTKDSYLQHPRSQSPCV